MCGIVGVYKQTWNNAFEDVIYGLRRLEYRGYDSAGVAVVSKNGFKYEKAVGKIQVLEDKIEGQDFHGNVSIGHTRWATHGSASIANAHPIVTKHVAVVHNGIIENYAALKDLENLTQESETDTEIVARLLDKEFESAKDAAIAVFSAIAKLRGAFALGILFKDKPDFFVGVKCKSPLIIGVMDDGYCFSSDPSAFRDGCRRVVYLEDNDIAIVDRGELTIYNDGIEVSREEHTYLSGSSVLNKEGYKHFMLKEIFEQPSVVANTISTYLENDYHIPFDPSKFNRVVIIACGSSYYAGLVARYWLEEFVQIQCDVEIASEFTYRKPVVDKRTLCVVISQSGETADTMNAMHHAKAGGAKVLALVNVRGSSIYRDADYVMLTVAGPEVGVASTKAFTAQLTTMAIVATHMTRDVVARQGLHDEMLKLPSAIQSVFALKEMLEELSDKWFAHFKNAIFLGRGPLYPVALEGALKLKEISYIHAEGYTAGELKHGPIALIDEDMPVVVLGESSSRVFPKLQSNIQNVLSRKGRVFFITDADVQEGGGLHHIKMPSASEFVAPILYTIPLQLIAYYTALTKGTDIDQPRNLAKSVTVE